MKKIHYKRQNINTKQLHPTKKYKSLARRKEKLKQELQTVEKLLKEEKSKVQFECEHCSALFAVGQLNLIQDYWYEEPHGCTGGDRWHVGEKLFVCPKCETKNRICLPFSYENNQEEKKRVYNFIEYDMIDYELREDGYTQFLRPRIKNKH